MFAKALFAFLALPGIVAFVIPYFIILISRSKITNIFSGSTIFLLGLIVLFWCVYDFYTIGKGSLAPWAPPKKLVIVGLYRIVRNPMYIGVLIILCSWSILFASLFLIIYAIILAIIFHLRVVLHEEKYLFLTYQTEWKNYKDNVPRWIPNFKKRSKL